MNGVKYTRLINKLSVQKVANMMGVSRPLVYYWERKVSCMSLKRQIQYANIFNIEQDILKQRFKVSDVQ